MIENWLGTTAQELLYVVVSSVAILLLAITFIRINGLRSLSKMSGFDFVVTVAFGSIVATVAATSASLWNGALAFAALLATQWAIAKMRTNSKLERYIDNAPLLLMDGSTFLTENLEHARVTRNDVIAKLREANVTRMDQVLAVVLETTGDMTVLHGDRSLEPYLLTGVKQAP